MIPKIIFTTGFVQIIRLLRLSELVYISIFENNLVSRYSRPVTFVFKKIIALTQYCTFFCNFCPKCWSVRLSYIVSRNLCIYFAKTHSGSSTTTRLFEEFFKINNNNIIVINQWHSTIRFL